MISSFQPSSSASSSQYNSTALKAFLNSLSHRSQYIFRAYFFHRLTTKEIADNLHLSPTTITRLKNRLIYQLHHQVKLDPSASKLISSVSSKD